MDPQATLKRYIDAFAAGDEEGMSQAAADYNVWISRAGFPAKLPDGREVYKLGDPTAVGVGDDAVFVPPRELAALLTPPEAPPESVQAFLRRMGLKERLHAALQAHSGCCLDNDEEVDMVLAAIYEAAQPRTGQ